LPILPTSGPWPLRYSPRVTTGFLSRSREDAPNSGSGRIRLEFGCPQDEVRGRFMREQDERQELFAGSAGSPSDQLSAMGRMMD